MVNLFRCSTGSLSDDDVAAARALADIATIGWVNNLITFYEARELVGFDSYAHVGRWLGAALERPAVQRGLVIPAQA